MLEPFFHPAFDDVFQVNDAERTFVNRNHQGGAAVARNVVGCTGNFRRELATLVEQVALNRLRRAFSNGAAIHIHATHPGLCSERNKLSFVLADLATAQPVFLFCEDNNAAAFGRFIRQTR